MKLSIVVPVYNESENILELYKRLHRALKRDFSGFEYEIVFVDDGSIDETFKKILSVRKKNKHVKVIKFSRNFGHHIALSAGMRHSTGAYTVIMDGDLQERPEDIIRLYKTLIRKKCDIVFGVKADRNDTFFKKLTSVLFWKTFGYLLGGKAILNQSTMRIFNKKVLSVVNEFDEAYPFYAGIFSWIGFRRCTCNITIDERFKGESKYSFPKMIGLSMSAILGFSNLPLYYISYLGIVISFVSFLIGFFYIIRKLFFGIGILGWPTLIVLLTFIGGLIILSIGILGIYISKIYYHSLDRPRYIIEKKFLT